MDARTISRQQSPTLEDVARQAGVSTATVSRALHRPETVREQLRIKVLRAVEKLGYVPHAGARALSLQRSGTVGVVVPTIDNAIFASGLQAFQQRMVLAGYHVLLAFSDYDPQQELAQVSNLIARGVDGIAMTGTSQHKALLSRLRQRGMPAVHTGSFPAPPDMACVGFRNRSAMMRAVRYLLDLGHRRIGMVAGIARSNERATERIAGVRQALRSAELPLDPALLIECEYSVQAAREATAQLLAQSPRPTALLCGNDVLAFGALLEAQARAVRVPAELSIIGFDDLELARHLQPALTTVRVPTAHMWTLAAEHLIGRLDGSVQTPIQTEIQVELVVRESTGIAPKTRR